MAIHRGRPACFGLAVVLSLLLSSAALADSNTRIVRLSYALGDVRLDRGDGRGFELAVMNMPVAHGNRVWTRNDALAEVEFEDGDTIRLTPETLVILHELSLRSNGTRVSLVELQEGEAYFNLRRDDDNDFRILVPGGELQLRKSSRLRVAVRGKQLDVAVMKGELEIVGSGERLLVKKGETLTIDPNEAGRYYLSRSINSASYDQWDKDRDSYRDRYATNYNYSSYGNYGGYSPYYSYGLSDLNYYGGYFNHPSYGWL
ncbi:MAG: FecR family protein, partial [Terriglobales bacterium]